MLKNTVSTHFLWLSQLFLLLSLSVLSAQKQFTDLHVNRRLLQTSLFGTASWGLNNEYSLEIQIQNDEVLLTANGPNDRFFGLGFDSSVMEDAYAIIINGTDVHERKLGDHTPGTIVQGSVTISSTDTTSDTLQRVVLSRSIEGLTSDHYTFPSSETTIPMIWTHGDETGEYLLEYHGPNRGTFNITLSAQISPNATTAATITTTASAEINETQGNVLYESGGKFSKTLVVLIVSVAAVFLLCMLFAGLWCCNKAIKSRKRNASTNASAKNQNAYLPVYAVRDYGEN
jgi:hypothetical protein